MRTQSAGRASSNVVTRFSQGVRSRPVRRCSASGISISIMPCAGPGFQVMLGRVKGPAKVMRLGSAARGWSNRAGACAGSNSVQPSNTQPMLHSGVAGKWLKRCASVRFRPSVLRVITPRTLPLSAGRGSHRRLMAAESGAAGGRAGSLDMRAV